MSKSLKNRTNERAILLGAALIGFLEISLCTAWLNPGKCVIFPLCRSNREHNVPTANFGKRKDGSKSALHGSKNEGTRSTDTNVMEKNDRKIYSMPALYDLAFGYRDFDEEVSFLLARHAEHNRIKTTDQIGANKSSEIRVLELAAGPARHSITALSRESTDDVSTVSVRSVVCIDSSQEMKSYGEDIADEELNSGTKLSFNYQVDDMKSFQIQSSKGDASFDTAWLLLGSLQHLTTNCDVLQCFRSIHNVLKPGGTLIIELPHPREVFKMGECTRNGWEVPLDDDEGNEAGMLQIIWGDDGDEFDPIGQVRRFTISMKVTGADESIDEIQSVKEIVPMRLFTAQEVDALARCSDLEVVAQYGALEEGIDVGSEEFAYRLVSVLRKPTAA